MLQMFTLKQEELDVCPHVTLTSQSEWDPRNVNFLSPRWYIEEEITERATLSGVTLELHMK